MDKPDIMKDSEEDKKKNQLLQNQILQEKDYDK